MSGTSGHITKPQTRMLTTKEEFSTGNATETVEQMVERFLGKLPGEHELLNTDCSEWEEEPSEQIKKVEHIMSAVRNTTENISEETTEEKKKRAQLKRQEKAKITKGLPIPETIYDIPITLDWNMMSRPNNKEKI